ncbi:MAG: response regulator-like protein [Erysipelotrichaceae bacterium]|nr:MAG: response regulator-like [Erysipelotrichaceae bacterium]TXT17116.1 MAG: response regulator-like protein [Erysipelotrichaceae bacterium]
MSDHLESLFTALLNNTPDLQVYFCDTQYRYIAFNQKHKEAVKQIWGTDIEVGMSLLDAITIEQDRVLIKFDYDRALKGETFTLIKQYADSDLANIYLERTLTPIKDEQGSIIGFIASARNITSSVQQSLDLKNSERLLELFFKQSLCGSFFMMLKDPVEWNDSVDKDAVLEYVFDNQFVTKANQAYLDQYGLTFNEHRILTPRVMFSHDLAQGKAAWKQLFDQGMVHIDTQELKADGTKIDIEGDYICLYDEQGRITGHFGTQQDITQRRQTESDLKQSHELMRTVIENDRGAVALFDQDMCYIYVSQRYLTLFKIEDPNIIGKSHYDVFPNLNHYYKQVHQRALAGQVERNDKDLFTHPDGSQIYIKWEVRPWTKNENQVGGIILYIEDITQEVQMQEKLLKQGNQLNAMFEQAAVGFVIGPLTGNYARVNQKFCDIVGYSSDELLKMTFRDITHPDDLNIDNLQTQRLINHQDTTFSTEKRYIRKDKSIVWVHITVSLLDPSSFDVPHVVVVSEDITSRKLAEEKMHYLSYHDQLTGLYNRRFYEEELRRLDHPRNYPLALIIGDINGLKLINDAFGHAMGDVLIQTVANTIKDICRKDEIIARIGGDEFVILLPKTQEQTATTIIERINRILSHEKIGEINLSIATGYGIKTSADEKTDEIFKQAEDSMYRQKLADSSSIMSKTIDIIMKSLYEKSPREMLHSKRVSELSTLIAKALKFDKSEINKIRATGLMHDIGKIGISDTVLNKPLPLSIVDQRDIERHSEVGYRILSAVNEFSEIAEFVLSHHEHWDGNGYPKKLKGKTIPIQSRIIAVADAYDAMTTDSIYMQIRSEDEAVSELIRCASTQFDPEIVYVFIERVLPKLSKTKDTPQDLFSLIP